MLDSQSTGVTTDADTSVITRSGDIKDNSRKQLKEPMYIVEGLFVYKYTNRIQGIYSTGNISSIYHIGNDEGRRPETFSYMLG